jgi:coenzyme F420-0:L-glutamate ligase/coenzyme F420-1:gamma-L-glutamate ligase
MIPRYEVIGVVGLPEIRRGDDLGRLIVEAAAAHATPLGEGDLLIVTQKVISKAEGRVVRLADVIPSPVALAMAQALRRDPRLVELILRESRRVVRMDKGLLIVETHHGWVCANGGVDQSNVDLDCVALLPEDPDRSAQGLRERVLQLTETDVPVIVSDTFGRPWREGLTNVAIGIAGLQPMQSYLGARDPAGRTLQATSLAVADELAGAAEPVMGKLNRVPAVIIRGLAVDRGEGTSKALLRDPSRDLFR